VRDLKTKIPIEFKVTDKEIFFTAEKGDYVISCI